MGRWQPDASGRLQQAAMELFEEQGFERTTVLQIAERAGLTERTFFRHFADKREVLFAGSEVLEKEMAQAIQAAPPTASAMDAVAAGLTSIGSFIPPERERVRVRSALIAANPELQERERKKLAALAAVASSALRRRGVDEPAAMLTSEVAIAAFRVAFARWIAADDARTLNDRIAEALADLRTLTA